MHFIEKDSCVHYLSNGTLGTLVAHMQADIEQLGTGLKKKRQIIHILWIRGGGPRMWISDGRGDGGRRMWIKKFLNVDIINFEKVDKTERGGWSKWIRLFC